MEDKSIDQLRLEAQELYQAKLRAYNDAKNGGTAVSQKTKVVERTAKSVVPKSEYISQPAFVEELPIAPKYTVQKASGPKNNWFVVSVFTLILIIVVMELFIFKT